MHSRSLSKVKSLPSRGTSPQPRSNIRGGGGGGGVVVAWSSTRTFEVDSACPYAADNAITRVFLSCLR